MIEIGRRRLYPNHDHGTIPSSPARIGSCSVSEVVLSTVLFACMFVMSDLRLRCRSLIVPSGRVLCIVSVMSKITFLASVSLFARKKRFSHPSLPLNPSGFSYFFRLKKKVDVFFMRKITFRASVSLFIRKIRCFHPSLPLLPSGFTCFYPDRNVLFVSAMREITYRASVSLLI